MISFISGRKSLGASLETRQEFIFQHRRDVISCFSLIFFFLIWHAPGVFGGQVYVAEDTLAYFFSNRAALYDLAMRGNFSFWDPLPGLGQPRLANLQSGSFAPLSLLFYFIPTATVFQFYPALVLGLLSVFTFALFRVKGVTQWPALFGALSWVTVSGVLTHVQHLAVIETLLFLPLTLFFWELALRHRQARFIVMAGVAFAFQCFGSSAQYLVYNGLLMALWMGRDIWAAINHREKLFERIGFVFGLMGVGFGIGSWQLLPFLEMVEQSHRNLLNDPDLFSGLFRASPGELVLALGAESFAFIQGPVLQHGAPYRNQPQLSLLTVGLACLALVRRPRPWAPALGVVFFLLGMLGQEGGVTPWLREFFPFVDRLRAPYRMIVPAAFLISWMAALGLQRVLDSNFKKRRLLAMFCVGWICVVGWTLKRPLDHYAPHDAYAVPASVENAGGRVVMDFRNSHRMPSFALNAGLAVGVPTLLMREVLIPASFFETYFAGQYGTLNPPEVFDQTIVSAALPFVNPNAPIWDAFGLETVVSFRGGVFLSQRRETAMDRFSLVPELEVEENSALFYQRLVSPDWDPRAHALVRVPVEVLPEPSGVSLETEIEILIDEPDRQKLEVQSSGGVLVTSELFFPGWEVQVDGHSAQPLQVQGALRGVLISAGLHEVDWRYRPTWWPWALLGSSGALLSVLGLWMHDHRRTAA